MLRQSQFAPPVPVVIARHLGLLDDVDVKTLRTSGSAEQLEGLLSGEIDLAVTAIDNLFAWVPAGADVRLIAQMETTTPLAFYGRPGTLTLSELDGERFAVDAATNGFALVARHVLDAAEVSVDFVEVGGVKERLDSLLALEVTGTLLGPPFDAEALAAGAALLTTVSEALPTFPGQGLVVRSELARSVEVTTYLHALIEATRATRLLSDAEGLNILEGAGFGGAAATAWHSRPRTLTVDPAGLTLLTRIRDGLGMLPDGIRLDILHDPTPLRAAA